MNDERRGCNVGCLALSAAIIAIDVAAWFAVVSFACWLAKAVC